TLVDEPLNVGAENQMKVGKAARLGGQEIQETVLRQHGDERETRPQPAEIGHGIRAALGDDFEFADLAVRDFQKAIGQAKLIEDFERRRMDRVAAEIAIKILVRFEQGDIDALPCQQE